MGTTLKTIGTFVNTVTNTGYTVLTTDPYSTIHVTTGASNQTVTLPSASANSGRTLQIKKIDSGAGQVVVTPAAGTIDGLSTFPLAFQWQSVTVISDGSNWFLKEYPNKFYAHTNDDNSSGQAATGETSFFQIVVPYSGIYTVFNSFQIDTAATSNTEVTGTAIIKTGSATYTSAVYRNHGQSTTAYTNTTGRGFGTPNAQWTGALSAGDTVHMGITVVQNLGADASIHSQHFFTVSEVRRV